MRLYYEWGASQLHKHGEELCGDSVAVGRRPDSVTLALSDGLGSGVKASILATLTTHIAMHLLENDLALSDVVETLSETLPVCAVRKLAYSTFAIAQFFGDGRARVVEFDAPAAMLLRRRKAHPLAYEERSVQGKTIREAVVDLALGDWVVFVTDGVLNAGIGGRYPLGWGWDQAARFLEQQCHQALSAQDLADKVAEAVMDLYAGAPGDDVSVVVVKARHKLVVTVLTGPPADRSLEGETIRRFIERGGRHAVCGGTTGQIVSRCIGSPIEVDLGTMTPDVPPMGRMNGVDLATEGILTLTAVRELLRSGAQKDAVKFRADGAAALLRLLLEADQVHFMVGTVVNPAHQNPELPHNLEIRLGVIRDIASELLKRGIEVSTESI